MHLIGTMGKESGDKESTALSPTEFETLFTYSEDEFRSRAPLWLSKVNPPSTRTVTSKSLEGLLSEYREAWGATRRLENLLASSGVPIPEDIPYKEAKQKIAELSLEINQVSGGKEYKKLCQELDKYTAALMASEEYLAELLEQEQKWEEENQAENEQALRKIRRHMPINVRFLSEQQLTSEYGLAKPMALKFKRSNVLQLLRANPKDIERMHPSLLENLKTSGLTLTERRALHHHLRTVRTAWKGIKEPTTERKYTWFQNLENKFKESVTSWNRHLEEWGRPSSSHSCKLIGMQCPFKADVVVDYNSNTSCGTGFPEGDVYEALDTESGVSQSAFQPSNKLHTPASPADALTRPTGALCFLQELSKSMSAKKEDNENELKSLVNQNVQPTISNRSIETKEARKEKSGLNASIGMSERNNGKHVKLNENFQHRCEEKRRVDRPLQLQKHYQGRIKMVQDALESCDDLDIAMNEMEAQLDRWIDNLISNETLHEIQQNQQIAEFTEAIKSLNKTVHDLLERVKSARRSVIECELAVDFVTASGIFLGFVLSRLKEFDKKDKTIKRFAKETKEALAIIHERSLKTLRKFNIEEHEPSRVIRTVSQIIEKKFKEKKKGKKSKTKRGGMNSQVSAEPIEVDVAPAESRDVTTAKADKSLNIKGKEQLRWLLILQLEDILKQKRMLEKVIANSGLSLPSNCISFQEAEARIADISKHMQEIGFRHPDYFKLEQEMEKCSAALLASDEYRKELARREAQWEKDVAKQNLEALKKIRRHMPVNIRNMSEAELEATPTPNGKRLPKDLIRKFKRTNALQLLRVDPLDIMKMHFADLEGLSLANTTLTELRAIYHHLSTIGPKWEKMKSEKKVERKYMWYLLVRNKLKNSIQTYDKHVQQYGPRGKHIDCPEIGRMCPLQADALVNYDGDFGFPEEDDYEVLEVVKEDLEDLKGKARQDAEQAIKERTAFWARS